MTKARGTARSLQSALVLPPLEADTTNAFADDPKAASLGQRLFYEKGYSGPIKVANDLGDVGEAGCRCYL